MLTLEADQRKPVSTGAPGLVAHGDRLNRHLRHGADQALGWHGERAVIFEGSERCFESVRRCHFDRNGDRVP